MPKQKWESGTRKRGEAQIRTAGQSLICCVRIEVSVASLLYAFIRLCFSELLYAHSTTPYDFLRNQTIAGFCRVWLAIRYDERLGAADGVRVSVPVCIFVLPKLDVMHENYRGR